LRALGTLTNCHQLETTMTLDSFKREPGEGCEIHQAPRPAMGPQGGAG